MFLEDFPERDPNSDYARIGQEKRQTLAEMMAELDQAESDIERAEQSSKKILEAKQIIAPKKSLSEFENETFEIAVDIQFELVY